MEVNATTDIWDLTDANLLDFDSEVYQAGFWISIQWGIPNGEKITVWFTLRFQKKNPYETLKDFLIQEILAEWPADVLKPYAIEVEFIQNEESDWYTKITKDRFISLIATQVHFLVSRDF